MKVRIDIEIPDDVAAYHWTQARTRRQSMRNYFQQATGQIVDQLAADLRNSTAQIDALTIAALADGEGARND